jgi:Fe-S cluster assembly ATPase SufC
MSENAYLVIKDLVVAPSSDPSKHILQGISLTIKPGEVHAIMGRTAPARRPSATH